MKKNYILFLCFSLLFVVIGFAQNKRIEEFTAINETVLNMNLAEKTQPVIQPMTTVNDTITAHWHQIFPIVAGCDTPVTYTLKAPAKHSYIAGHNKYGDAAKAQLFDTIYGVTSSNGTITNLLLWVGGKIKNAGTGSWTPTIWADNAGKPGAVLGTAPKVTISLMDTSLVAKKKIGNSSSVKGMYNVNATFSTAIQIPATRKFWAGFTITYSPGDSAGLVTSKDGDTSLTKGDFLKASTHTFGQWNGGWSDFVTDWGPDFQVALGVYPILSMITTNVNENNSLLTGVRNYPNPAKDNTAINYSLKENSNVQLSLFDIVGKNILELNQGIQSSGNHNLNLDVSSLSSGIYFYTISAGNSKMTGKISVAR